MRRVEVLNQAQERVEVVQLPPAFNVVGQSGETQLADAIGSQTQRPSRAYVVSNDVTTAQETG